MEAANLNMMHFAANYRGNYPQYAFTILLLTFFSRRIIVLSASIIDIVQGFESINWRFESNTKRRD